MSKQELKKVLQDFAVECDKYAQAWRGEPDKNDRSGQSEESRKARAQVLEAHRDWANNLLPKI